MEFYIFKRFIYIKKKKETYVYLLYIMYSKIIYFDDLFFR